MSIDDRLDKIAQELEHLTELVRQLVLMAQDHERKLSQVRELELEERLASLERWRGIS